MQEFWVFGYGSLMWRPGFAFAEQRRARLSGLHRRLCVYSHVHRGTPDRPGLVMGLDRGGACRGIAFRVEPADWPETLAYLRAREQVTNVYLEVLRPVQLLGDGAREVMATAYAVNRGHPQYAGKLGIEAQLELIAQGHGISGPCADYVLSTVAHLSELGVADPMLQTLAERLSLASHFTPPLPGSSAHSARSRRPGSNRVRRGCRCGTAE
jgi:cation transport protein ChaC